MPGNRGIKADQAMSYAKLEGRARHLREVLELDPNGQLPGVATFERLRRIVYRLGDETVGVTYAVEELPSGVEGWTTFDLGHITVTLTPRTYTGLERGTVRARFTLAHELGHLELHSPELLRLAALPHNVRALARGPRHYEVFYDTEWQADGFAAALLMPATGLAALEKRHGALTTRLVADFFAVSMDAARIRIDSFTKRRRELLGGRG
jgi:hypothetical protein